MHASMQAFQGGHARAMRVRSAGDSIIAQIDTFRFEKIQANPISCYTDYRNAYHV
jgi:hypothetical protein